MTDTKPAEALLPFIKTTGEMRARLRELSDTTGKDDYDRCVLMLLDDFAQLMAHVAPLADAYRRAAVLDRMAGKVPEGWRLVPINPTHVMMETAFAVYRGKKNWDDVLRSAILAAPEAPR